MSRFGMSALLEACKFTAAKEEAQDIATEMIIGESATTDDIKNLFIGDGSVESEMDGDSLTPDEERQMEKLLELIPEDDDDDENMLSDLDSTLESFIVEELNGGGAY